MMVMKFFARLFTGSGFLYADECKFLLCNVNGREWVGKGCRRRHARGTRRRRNERARFACQIARHMAAVQMSCGETMLDMRGGNE